MLSRLITFLLAFAAFVGVNPPSAASRAEFGRAGWQPKQGVSAPARSVVTSATLQREIAPARSGSQPVVDPAWLVRLSAAVAPTAQRQVRNAPPNHGGAACVAGWALRGARGGQSELHERRIANWAVVRRGYRATGPPAVNESIYLEKSLASLA